MKSDTWYMSKALEQAQKAFDNDEVPIGAIVVSTDGTIIGRGANAVEQKKTQAAHAEVIAIIRAGKKINDWRLEGCILFVTLEPCGMCMNLIELSRIKRVVFAADSPLFSYRLDKDGQIPIYKKNIATCSSGVCSEEASQLLKTFFRKKRKEKREWSKKSSRGGQ